MVDEVDIANKNSEFFLELALNNHKKRSQQTIAATGFCLNCNEPLSGDKCWCDNDCRDDWEKRNR